MPQTLYWDDTSGAGEETEQAVLKYGARVPEPVTKRVAKSHSKAVGFASRHGVKVRSLR